MYKKHSKNRIDGCNEDIPNFLFSFVTFFCNIKLIAFNSFDVALQQLFRHSINLFLYCIVFICKKHQFFLSHIYVWYFFKTTVVLFDGWSMETSCNDTRARKVKIIKALSSDNFCLYLLYPQPPSQPHLQIKVKLFNCVSDSRFITVRIRNCAKY